MLRVLNVGAALVYGFAMGHEPWRCSGLFG